MRCILSKCGSTLNSYFLISARVDYNKSIRNVKEISVFFRCQKVMEEERLSEQNKNFVFFRVNKMLDQFRLVWSKISKSLTSYPQIRYFLSVVISYSLLTCENTLGYILIH